MITGYARVSTNDQNLDAQTGDHGSPVVGLDGRILFVSLSFLVSRFTLLV